MHNDTPLLSVITPAYNEEKNLPKLYQLLKLSLNDIGITWEWIIIDDHSLDKTFEVAKELPRSNTHIKLFRFSRNFGSHTAIRCGLDYAKGSCAVVLAADLQDPPEVIPNLLKKWRQGAEIVWAVRQSRQGETWLTKISSRLYYFMMRKLFKVKNIPMTGADFFLIDRKVIDAFLQFKERSISVFSLLSWIGYKQAYLYYDKLARAEGCSGWTFSKKITLAIDSVTSHSYSPIRVFSIIGFVIASIGFLYAIYILFNRIIGVSTVQGWTSLMIVILIIGGLHMMMLGILGEYLWRTLEQSRKRPLYLVEAQSETLSQTNLKITAE